MYFNELKIKKQFKILALNLLYMCVQSLIWTSSNVLV